GLRCASSGLRSTYLPRHRCEFGVGVKHSGRLAAGRGAPAPGMDPCVSGMLHPNPERIKHPELTAATSKSSTPAFPTPTNDYSPAWDCLPAVAYRLIPPKR